MSEWALFWGVAAMLCAAYALHGGWLAGRWGVDPSRRTQDSLSRMSAGRRIFAGLFALEMLVLQLWLMAGVFAFACSLFGEAAGIVIGVLYVILCGAMGFAALFVSVRTGDDLAHIAGTELFSSAKDLACFLEILTVVPLAGLMMTAKYLTMNAECFLSWISVLWLAVAVMAVSHRFASTVRNERRMRPMSYGVSVFSGVMAMACYAAREEMKMLAEHPVMVVMVIAFLLSSVLVPICLGGDAIRGLLKSELPRKKKVPGFVWTMVSAMLGAATAFVPDAWLLAISVAAGAGYVLLAALTCAKWFNRIGRGLFSKN